MFGPLSTKYFGIFFNLRGRGFELQPFGLKGVGVGLQGPRWKVVVRHLGPDRNLRTGGENSPPPFHLKLLFLDACDRLIINK